MTKKKQKLKDKTRSVDKYSVVELIQPLPHGNYLKQRYEHLSDSNLWKVIHLTNSSYHLCPYDGVFRNCEECGADREDFNEVFCRNKMEFVDGRELNERIADCRRANLEVKFY